MKKFGMRDMFYITVYLLSIIVLVMTVKIETGSEVIDYVGFAGTLISILLALVAIIYSFFQSYLNQSSTSRLSETVNKVEESFKNVESYENNIKSMESALNISIEEIGLTSTEIKSTLDSIEELKCTIEESNATTNSYVSTILSKQVGNTDGIEKIEIKYFINYAESFRGARDIIRKVKYCYENEVMLKVTKLANELADKEKESNDDFGQLFMGTIAVIIGFLKSNGTIKTEGSPSKMMITFMDQDLIDFIENDMEK